MTVPGKLIVNNMTPRSFDEVTKGSGCMVINGVGTNGHGEFQQTASFSGYSYNLAFVAVK